MAQILLVEDNTHNQKLFLTTLRHHGHDVALAEDGAKALEQLEQQVPDIVLLDLSIPKVDGWTVARKVREHDDAALREVPILALTAHAMKGDRERALQAGCTAYLSKPVSPRELTRRVDKLLAKRGLSTAA